MGAIAAMHAIETVLERHERDLRAEALDELPTMLRHANPVIDLVNECHWIERWVTVQMGGLIQAFELRRLDLYELAARYPELDLGW